MPPDLPAPADACGASLWSLVSLFLILQLQCQTCVRFLAWLVIGLVIYFTYGRQHSLLTPDSPLHKRAQASGTQR
jgi:hypothetical protein